MNTTQLIIAGLMFASTFGASAVETNGLAPGGSSRVDYVSFRMIADRNIFNPHRAKGVPNRPPQRTEPERIVRSDRFALLGTMSYEKGRYAFFDGSSTEFRKVAKPEDSIAGFKIAEVAPTCVKLLLTNGQLLELCVGMQMKKSEEQGWQLAGKAEAAEGTTRSFSSSSSSSASSGPESEDVLKRLLEKRSQEGVPVEAAALVPTKVEEVKPAAAPAPGESDEVLKRLLQKREQEQNK